MIQIQAPQDFDIPNTIRKWLQERNIMFNHNAVSLTADEMVDVLIEVLTSRDHGFDYDYLNVDDGTRRCTAIHVWNPGADYVILRCTDDMLHFTVTGWAFPA